MFYLFKNQDAPYEIPKPAFTQMIIDNNVSIDELKIKATKIWCDMEGEGS